MSASLRVTVEEVRLRNFRAFDNARLVLSNLTFLVGRNGAGKSSLLDAVDLLRQATTDSLENALDRRGGLGKVQRARSGRGRKPPMGIATVLRITFPSQRQTHALYGFELNGEPKDGMLNIRERLQCIGGASFERSDGTFSSDLKIDVSPPAGNLVLPLIARSDSLWGHVLDTIRNSQPYEISPSHMAAAQKIGELSRLARDGSNAGDVLKVIEGTSAHRWLVQRIGLVADGLIDVRAEALMGRRVLCFIQKHGRTEMKFDAGQVSQGTLRSLGILLALRQSPKPALVLVDEIENSLHPGALSVVLDAALASSDATRVILTTHSPEVLSHPSVIGERVRIIEWRGGTSHIFRPSTETEAAISTIDTVGWMLRSNTLWPRPEPERLSDDLFDLPVSKQ